MQTKVDVNARASRAGFSSGYEHGLRDGACEFLYRHLQPPVSLKRRSRILYVPQGFEAIDQGVIQALSQIVREVYIAEPAKMAEQASLLRPDWMLVLNGLHVFPANHLEQVDIVRSMGIRTAIWFADDPYVTADTMYVAPRYDVVLTHELSTIPMYRERGCPRVIYMPLAVDHNRFKPMKVEEKYRSDVCFIGQGFWNRVEMFDALAPYLSHRQVFIAGSLWERMRHFKELQRFIRLGWLPVEESIRYYNGARIVINMHRTTEVGRDNKNVLDLPGRSINPRTYEISACGTLQLTDVREDLPRYYELGTEIETFTDAEELRSKLEFYLAHEEERRRIALRGLRRTLAEHTYLHRLQQIAELLRW